MNSTVTNCDTTAKPFCCPICVFSTKFIQNLHRHIKRKHSDYYYTKHQFTLKKNQYKPRIPQPVLPQPPSNQDDTVQPMDTNGSFVQPKVNEIQNNNNKEVEPMDTSNGMTPQFPSSPVTSTLPPVPLQFPSPATNTTSTTQTNTSPTLVPDKDKKKGIVIEANSGLLSTDVSKEVFDIRLIPSFKILIVGPSGSGKTLFVRDLLLNLDNFTIEKPKKTILMYTVWQPAYDQMQSEQLIDAFIQDNSELESQLDSYTTGEEVLFIFDDMISSTNIDFISKLFMVQGRHKNISLIFITQQGFRNNEAFKSISNNTGYMVLMKNKRNVSDVQNLAKQITPGPRPLLKQIWDTATKDSYSYLFLNLMNESKNETKYLSHLFEKNHIVKAYVPT